MAKLRSKMTTRAASVPKAKQGKTKRRTAKPVPSTSKSADQRETKEIYPDQEGETEINPSPTAEDEVYARHHVKVVQSETEDAPNREGDTGMNPSPTAEDEETEDAPNREEDTGMNPSPLAEDEETEDAPNREGDTGMNPSPLAEDEETEDAPNREGDTDMNPSPTAEDEVDARNHVTVVQSESEDAPNREGDADINPSPTAEDAQHVTVQFRALNTPDKGLGSIRIKPVISKEEKTRQLRNLFDQFKAFEKRNPKRKRTFETDDEESFDEESGDEYVPSSEDVQSSEESDAEAIPPTPVKTNSIDTKRSKFTSLVTNVRRARKHYPRIRNRPQTSANARPRKKCHLCELEVVDMARHLRHAHEVAPKTEAMKIAGVNRTLRSITGRRHKVCPIAGCPAVVKRLDRHLQGAHRMTKDESHKTVLQSETQQQIREEAQHQIREDESAETENALATSCSSTPSSSRTEPGSMTERQQTLMEFQEYLTSANRCKTADVAKQHVQQLKHIWNSTTSDSSLESFIVPDIIQTEWLEGFRDVRLPGTVKSYLGSLKEFAAFLIIRDKTSNGNRLKIAAERWSQAMSKITRKRIVERQVLDVNESVQIKDIEAFNKSSTADLAQKYFENIKVGEMKSVSCHQYTLMRNYLMLQIQFQNAQRAGALTSMTIRSVRYATMQGNRHVISVHDHKTGYRTPAMIGLSQDLYRYLEIYLKVRRMMPGFSPEQDESTAPVFLNWALTNGSQPRPVLSSQFSVAINAIWKMGTVAKPITATKIRKLAVTEVRQSKPDARESLASHMTHRASTADVYYQMHGRQQEANTVSELINATLCRKPPSTKEDENETVENEEHGNSDREEAPMEVAGSSLEEEQEEETSLQSARRCFTRGEQASLLKLCKLIICSRGGIQQKDVSSILLKSAAGSDLLQRFTLKQLSDRVRTARKGWLKGKLTL